MTKPLFVKQRRYLPDPTFTMEDGLLAFGDELTVEILLEAYSFGVFPWPHEDMPVLWFSPPERGVLDFKDLHVSKSLKKFMKQTKWEIKFNTDFAQVISRCKKSIRRNQTGTWITPMLERAYNEFHKAGYAHSIECWDKNKLVGGLYGVYVGGVFSGESMFFDKDNASKYCLLKLIEKLKENNLTWMDIQMVTPNLEAFGGKYIQRAEFLERLNESQKVARPLKL